ncbi:hypothetical protein PAXINDRAFT_170664 [Paxillus involutus ATCC 200175]|uniref:Uncharacterized protein n=1 Tax=Paxillus involutus ATCC 200175 TaxID=664439 RepID=A0A0C9TCE6_PAXIN|nr:hypothetical protein PAXINDRAFT_170664 [Paxillus involutus ATCC 200175]
MVVMGTGGKHFFKLSESIINIAGALSRSQIALWLASCYWATTTNHTKHAASS